MPVFTNWASLHGAVWYTDGGSFLSALPPLSTAFGYMNQFNWNFIRFVINWNDITGDTGSSRSAVLAYLDSFASAADAAGIPVQYAFYNGYPSTINSFGRHPPNSWFNQFFANSLSTPTGQTVWDYMVSDYWMPLIQHTANHSSTVGYELINEPDSGWCTTAQLQAYHTFMGSAIRGMAPSATIFFMGLGSDGRLYGGTDITQVVPTGISNIGFDFHSYWDAGQATALAAEQGWIQDARSVGVTQIICGEWNWSSANGVWSPDNSSNTTAQNFLTTQLGFLKQNSIGSAMWAFSCGANYVDDWEGLLTYLPACQPWWYTNMIASTIQTVYGGGGSNPVLSALNITSVSKV